jgi:hydroxymethylbilane synthase
MANHADTPLRVGTRGSRLALWQAERVAAALRGVDAGLAIEIVSIESAGDRHAGLTIGDLGVIGVFTREIEQALLAGRIDVAVHSLKDLPTAAPPELEIVAVLPRDDPRDAIVAPALAGAGATLAALPAGARIATSSLRRRAEILRHRPDCRVVELRGNVPTRIAKVERGEVDGVVLSQAGLVRLGLAPRGRIVLDPEIMLPAPAQGTIAIQVRAGDAATRARVAPLDDAPTRWCTTVERAVLAALGGGCRVPLGVLARMQEDRLTVHARVATPDGTRMLEEVQTGVAHDPDALVQRVAGALRARGADAILAALDRL